MEDQTNGRRGSVNDLVERVLGSVVSYDVYTLVLLAVFAVLSLIYYPYSPVALGKIFLDAIIALAVGSLILLHAVTDVPLFALLRRFYVIPIIYLMYDQVHVYVPVVHPIDYDQVFINADRWLFGVDPTVWLERYSFPLLTEYLQITYFLFYLLPIMQAVELWKKGRVGDLDVFARGMAFCYFVSYLAYFAMPAIGPRFTLHEFSQLDADLPGVWLTSWIREVVNVGGGVAVGMTEPESVVIRDCMPSGHTMMTLVNILFGFRFRSNFRWVFVVVGGSLIVSTVYLRYHYVVDVIVGIVIALLFLPMEPAVDRMVQRGLSKVRLRWKTLSADM